VGAFCCVCHPANVVPIHPYTRSGGHDRSYTHRWWFEEGENRNPSRSPTIVWTDAAFVTKEEDTLLRARARLTNTGVRTHHLCATRCGC